MPYIVLIGILMGVVVPIWSVALIQVPMGKYTSESGRSGRQHLGFGEVYRKRREIVYLVKRLLYMPRMPSETTRLIS